MTEDHFRKLENMYRSAPINLFYQPAISVKSGKSEITINVRPEFFHAAGAVHGSVYFKLLDDAAYFAANSLVTDVFLLTSSFQIYLLRPMSDGKLTAHGHTVHETRSVILADSTLTNEEGKMIARGTGSFMRGRTALSAEIGYR